MTLWFSDSAWKINFPLFAEAMIKFQQFGRMRDTDANSKKREIIAMEAISHQKKSHRNGFAIYKTRNS